MADYHAHTELEDSSISGVENPANVADQFVTKRVNGKVVRVKAHVAAKTTGQRQSYLQRDRKLKYPVSDILEAARRFDHKDAVIGYGQMVAHDLRERHTGPNNYYSATVLNTALDAFEFLKWRRDGDFNMFPRNEAIDSIKALFKKIGLPLDLDERHLQAE